MLPIFCIPKNYAAISINFKRSEIYTIEPKNEPNQFKILRSIVRLEKIDEGKKKVSWWKYIFWSSTIVGIFLGFHFLFPELALIDLVLFTIGFFALFFLVVVGFGALLQWIYDRAKRRRLN